MIDALLRGERGGLHSVHLAGVRIVFGPSTLLPREMFPPRAP